MREAIPRDTALPGGYVIESLLAEGRVCNVYRARSPEGDEVAARVLRDDLAADLSEWFLSAARTRAALDHPIIPKVFAVGLHEGVPVEVTELLEGRTAQDLLDERQNGLDVPTALRMIRSVAAALDHLHERTPALLHRALLPEQVLVRASDGAVKLLAVGDADRPRIAVTRPAYLSPEELAGVTSLSPRADVFSLATLAYELFTGRPAFVGGGDVVLDIVRMGRLPRLREHRTDLSPRADGVLREAWSVSPEDRPVSAGRFASLLADAVNQQAQTLVNIPTVSRDAPEDPAAQDARMRANTLVGAGPVDVAARRAQREERPTVLDPPPEPEASEPTPLTPTPSTSAREHPIAPRPPRAGRPAAQQSRAFLPRPGDTIEDATRPEIRVPAELRDVEPVRPITPAPAPPPSEAPAPASVEPVVAPPAEAAPPAPQPVAVVEARPAPETHAPIGPLSGTHFSPAPQPQPQPVAQHFAPQAPMAYPAEPPAPAHLRDDEDTKVIDIPRPRDAQPLWRSPIVIAGALIAHAIVIAGIAHAIAWAQVAHAPPTVVQAPAPTCAPCAACPVCPPPPRVEAPSVAAPVAARPTAPRTAPARSQLVREIPRF